MADSKIPTWFERTVYALAAAGIVTFGWYWAGLVMGVAVSKPVPTRAIMPAYAVARTVTIWSREGEGAGVRISPRGHILTVAHLFGVSEKFATVELPDKTMLPAEILFVDERDDLALIKTCEEKTLYTVLAPDSPRVGAHLWVVGAPLGFEFSVGDGRVAAHRKINGRSLMQITATINPGNSGGPVLNDNGELVGISDLIYYSTRTAGVTPVGFAGDDDALHDFLDRFKGLDKVWGEGVNKKP